MKNEGTEQQCTDCIKGYKEEQKCNSCQGTGWVITMPIDMQCEHENCTRKGKDYKIGNCEPVHLCILHYIKEYLSKRN